MDILNPRTMKEQAAARLMQQRSSPRRLALIHAGAIFLALMAVTGINYYVNQRMNAAVGLSGMGMLSVLETVQAVLGYALNIALPFWQMGFVFAALRMAHAEQVKPASLTEGFRRFGPLLRLMLLRGLVYGIVAIACVYLSTMIYLVTPSAQPLLEMMMPIAESGATMEQMQEMIWQLPMDQVTSAMMPVFWILIPVYVLAILPVYYRFRLADLIIMDKPGTNALAALVISNTLSRKRRLALLRLDLSFWWYYALQLLGALLCWMDMLLPLMGISAAGISLGCYVLGQGVQLLVFWYAGSQFHTTWAVAYDELLQQPIPVPQKKAVPKNLPWDEYNSDN